MSDKRIALINPPSPPGQTANREGVGGFGNVYPGTNGFVYPPHTLAYLASSLRNAGFDVRIVDCVARKWGSRDALKELERQISGERNPVLGAFISYPTFDQDLGFADALSVAFPEACVILFGQVLRYLAQEAADHTRAALVLQAEPEAAVVAASEIARSHESLGRIVTPTQLGCGELVEDLDSLPFPAWNLCGDAGSGSISVYASRGCDDECLYCPYVSAQGHGRRARSVSSVMEELRYISLKFKPQVIVFRDPAFAGDRNRVVDLCESIVRSGLTLRWQCESRPEHFDAELVALMKEAGCDELKIGLETTDESLLLSMGRVRSARDADGYVRAVSTVVRECTKEGVRARVFVMLGLPGQGGPAIVQTRSFLERLQPQGLNVKRIDYYPGIGILREAIPEPNADGETLLHLRDKIEGRWIEMRERPSILGRARRKIEAAIRK